MKRSAAVRGVAVGLCVALAAGGPALAADGTPAGRTTSNTVTTASVTPAPPYRWFGPYSGFDYYDIYFNVDQTFAEHCLQNNGAGEFHIYTLQGYQTSYVKSYRCTYLLTTEQQLRDSGLPVDDPYETPEADGIYGGLQHDDYDDDDPADPDRTNPDQDSPRYRFFFGEGPNGWYSGGSDGVFYPGYDLAPFYYEGSPAGDEGYYYIFDVDCDPRIGPERRLPTLQEVQELCDETQMRQLAVDLTTGPTRTLTVGINPSYVPYD